MDGPDAVEAIKAKFAEEGSPAAVPFLKRGSFEAKLSWRGVRVSNLGTQPLLPWQVFEETCALLVRSGGSALRGNAMNCRLGDPGLPLDSVEGHIAHMVYEKRKGASIFRRIVPIACILIWAGVCEAAPGKLVLCQPTA